jgi:hypothetical protein
MEKLQWVKDENGSIVSIERKPKNHKRKRGFG